MKKNQKQIAVAITTEADTPAEENASSPIDIAAAKSVAEIGGVPTPEGITEEAIAEKVSAGLRREQAIEVLQSQAAHDAALAAAEKGKGKA